MNKWFLICSTLWGMSAGMIFHRTKKAVVITHTTPSTASKTIVKGYIIITAWGDEASDPLVVDQNKN